MNIHALTCKITSLEHELEILRAYIKDLIIKKPSREKKGLSALYNILKHKGKFTEKEINNIIIKSPPAL